VLELQVRDGKSKQPHYLLHWARTIGDVRVARLSGLLEASN
jgi:hypothetical protein